METKMTKRRNLPKSLYVIIETPDNDEPYFVAAEDMSYLGIEVGDKKKIGMYKLVGTHDAEGMIETSKLRPAK
jgi:hypothetical protein